METMTGRQIMILRSLRQNLSGTDDALLDDVINGRLSINDIQRVCGIINDEYLMNGIEEDYSPNQYGRDLENLLRAWPVQVDSADLGDTTDTPGQAGRAAGE